MRRRRQEVQRAVTPEMHARMAVIRQQVEAVAFDLATRESFERGIDEMVRIAWDSGLFADGMHAAEALERIAAERWASRGRVLSVDDQHKIGMAVVGAWNGVKLEMAS